MFAKNKQKFKRQDFICENGWFETLVKLPGSLHMQQFQISDCEQCQIYLLDSNACVYVDDCKFCTIFIGPSESSIFVRDCHYLNVVCMGQQFRLRDSTHCTFWLWSESQPIIESSHDITFHCFPQTMYNLIIDQMKSANLKFWNNNWFDIYDFTPRKFSKQNFKIQVKQTQEDLNKVQKIHHKMKQLKLKMTNKLIPFSQSTSFCLSNGIKSYAVAIIFPIPEQSVGLPVLHSRTGKFPSQLAQFVSNEYLDKICLFVKIKNSEIQKWAKLIKNGNNVNMVKIIEDIKGKQVLESTIFVPFRDEREQH